MPSEQYSKCQVFLLPQKPTKNFFPVLSELVNDITLHLKVRDPLPLLTSQMQSNRATPLSLTSPYLCRYFAALTQTLTIDCQEDCL